MNSPVVNELPLSSNQLVPIRCRLVEEASVDFRFLVFHRDVTGEDKGIGGSLGHVWVSSTVVQHQTLHQLGVELSSVLQLQILTCTPLVYFNV